MIFFIILIISFISALFIFKNIIPNISNKKKSFYKIERKILAFLMLFSISSFIYYNIGDPFINIKELNSSRKKLKETEVQKNKDFVKNLNPISYKFRTARGEDTTSGGVKYGFSAQDILALETANGGSNVIVDNEFEENLSLTSSYLIPVLVNAIKQQQTQIETLETKVTTLENQRADLEARITALENA